MTTHASPANAATDLNTFLAGVHEAAEQDLASPVEVVDLRAIPDDIGKLPFGKNQAGSYVWRKIADAAVVVTDLKASTAVSYSKQDRVGARLYEASTGGCVNVLNRFSPGFVDIQGDGVFAIFTGDRFLERALCAAVSLNTFGQNLRQTLAKELGDDVREMRESGLRIGADRGALLVKRIGVRGTHNEPVWAGKPVNFATKCAQEADAGQVVVTARFFGDFKDNEFVRYSCGCVDGENRSEAGPLWERVTVPELGERHSSACRLRSAWCHQHGDEFARAILSGEKRRRGLNTGSLKKWREPEETRNDLE